MTGPGAAEPLQIVAGDSCAWARDLPEFSPLNGWALSYVLISQGKTPISIEAVASGGLHLVELASSTTAAWAPGSYRWTALVARGTERKTLCSGSLDLLPDPTKLDATHDPRSFAERCLAAVEAAIEGRAGDPLLEWEIQGRRVKDYPMADLLDLRRRFQEELRRQRGGSPFSMFRVNLG